MGRLAGDLTAEERAWLRTAAHDSGTGPRLLLTVALLSAEARDVRGEACAPLGHVALDRLRDACELPTLPREVALRALAARGEPHDQRRLLEMARTAEDEDLRRELHCALVASDPSVTAVELASWGTEAALVTLELLHRRRGATADQWTRTRVAHHLRERVVDESVTGRERSRALAALASWAKEDLASTAEALVDHSGSTRLLGETLRHVARHDPGAGVLSRSLASTDAEVRLLTAEALASRSDLADRPLLLTHVREALHDAARPEHTSTDRRRALHALARVRDAAVRETLVHTLRDDPDVTVRAACVRILGEDDDDRAALAVRAAARHDVAASVRRLAALRATNRGSSAGPGRASRR